YLTAYLLSGPCQEWLAGRSSGSVIRGLRKEFIEALPVPVPPLPVQQRVGEAFRLHQEDAFKTLAALLFPTENRLKRWVSESLHLLKGENPEDASDPSWVVRTRVF